MSYYKITEKKTGKTEEIEAVSQRQALYKAALKKTENKDQAGKLFQAMLKSHNAIVINDPNQMKLF